MTELDKIRVCHHRRLIGEGKCKERFMSSTVSCDGCENFADIRMFDAYATGYADAAILANQKLSLLEEKIVDLQVTLRSKL